MLRRRTTFRRYAGRVAASSASALLALSACGTEQGDNPTADGWSVAAAFYPLQFVTERVGGDLVTVTNLTQPGVEPHDLELAPQDFGTLTDADVVVYLAGFQPAVDDAVAQKPSGEVLDVSQTADLSLSIVDNEDGGEQVPDPHFWLDPLRLADVADEVALTLSRVDPAAEATFEANAAALREDLETLDVAFDTGLARCERRQLVTSHSAFGYLADAYDLEQIGLTGLTPESEPNPQDLADVTDFVETKDVQTIFYETLVNPDVAETVADATGASTDVLDPIEGLSDLSQGDDYLQIMESNLSNLQGGLSCR